MSSIIINSITRQYIVSTLLLRLSCYLKETIHRSLVTKTLLIGNNFTESTSDVLKSVVHGVVLGVPIPFDLPNGNGCKDSGVTCPLTAGQTYNYETTLPVLSSYPKVRIIFSKGPSTKGSKVKKLLNKTQLFKSLHFYISGPYNISHLNTVSTHV